MLYMGQLKILFVGRLEEDTGILIYLKALSILKNKKFDFEFSAVGDGLLRSDVEKYGVVYGFINEIRPYILKSDVVFGSSYLSIIESMSLRRPIFAVYNNPLKKDYLKMTPFANFISISGSPEELARKVLSFMRNPRLKTIENAFEWTKEETWDKIANLYLKLYRL